MNWSYSIIAGKRSLPTVTYLERHCSFFIQRESEGEGLLAHGQGLGDVGANVQAWTVQKFWPFFGARSHPHEAAAKTPG